MFSGCDGMGGGGNGIQVFDPHTGTYGLKIELLANSPPESVKDGGYLRTGIMIQNEGAFDVTDGKASIIYNIADLSINNPSQSLNLEGKSKIREKGEGKTIFWEADVSDVQEDITSQLSFIVTYKYQTNAFIDYCIDPDQYDEKVGEKSCTAQETISLSGQGAPVSVSKIISTYYPSSENSGEIELDIEVKNLRNGKIFKGSNNLENSNKAILKGFISGQQIDCDSELSFEENSATTKCYFNYNYNAEETTPLHIVVDYVYQEETESEEFLIEKK